LEDTEGSYILISILLLSTLPITLSFKPKLSFLASAISGLAIIVLSILSFNKEIILNIPSSIDYLTFSFRLDNLSAFFVGVISLISFATSIYSLNYVEEFKNKRLLAFLYNFFISSIVFVVLSSNAFSFLIFWEIMSVISYFLVIFNYKDEENKNAGIYYIFMTHFGTGFIILSFIFMFLSTNSLDFTDWAKSNLDENTKILVFIFSLIGFGTKAGIFPLHIWLPKAHPVAPSNVSAIMSGVMIKTAVYMLVRFYFEFLKDYSFYLGIIVLAIGAISAIYGIMYAYINNDIKRMLAYSSMENIGIIFMGMGLSMMFLSQGNFLLAGISFIAFLYHTLNHAVFKSLLFMSAGTILFNTHKKNIEELGGLVKFMPKTAVITLIGILGIIALPPFNGFVSEWLIYQSLLFSNNIDNDVIQIFTPIFASLLALTGAFALGTFSKMFGLTFLGKPRTEYHAKESKIFMLTGMFLLSILVVILGIFPMIPIYIIDDIFKDFTQISIFNIISYKYGFIIAPVDYEFGRLSPIGLFLAGVVAFIVVYLSIRLVSNAKTRYYETWACGLTEDNLTNKAQYSATGFSSALRRIFSFVYGYKEELKQSSGKLKYFYPEKRYILEIYDVIEKIYNRILNVFINIFLKVRYYFQAGIIHVYIAYIVITLIGLLIFVLWF